MIHKVKILKSYMTRTKNLNHHYYIKHNNIDKQMSEKIFFLNNQNKQKMKIKIFSLKIKRFFGLTK